MCFPCPQSHPISIDHRFVSRQTWDELWQVHDPLRWPRLANLGVGRNPALIIGSVYHRRAKSSGLRSGTGVVCGKTGHPMTPLYIYIFHGKIHGFRLRFSLKPIHWLTVRFYHNSSSRLKLELPYPRITLVADLQELCRSSFHWFHWRWPGASTCAEMRARCL